MNDYSLNHTDKSNAIKFIRNTKWTAQSILKFNHNFLKDYTGEFQIEFASLDDTLFEKQKESKNFEWINWLYSHVKRCYVFGHCMVSVQHKAGKVSYPSDFEVWEKGKSKIQIACDLINRFTPFGNGKVYWLMDSWYTSKEIFKTAKKRNFEVIGAIKSNRIFKFKENGIKHKLSVYAKNLKNASFEKIKVKETDFMVKRINVWLNGIGQVTILISKRIKDGSKLFILSTDMNLSSEEILKYYSNRWDIETNYFYCKNRLGMKDYQMTNIKSIVKYFSLVFSSYTLLESIRISENKNTIGLAKKYFQIIRKRKYVENILTMVKKKMTIFEIYKILNLTI